MVDGFYAIYYTGLAGSGFGILVFVNGIISGVDLGGIRYDGEYTLPENTEMVEGTLKMSVPAGAILVTGGVPSTEPCTLEFPLSLPSGLGDGQPVELKLPTGPVNVVFRKLRDFPA
jgi:hypothetical protein